jgi:hypothetical protein
MNSKDVGDRSVSMVVAAFLKLGVPVLTPFGDNQRYDIAIDRAGTFYRVQCKTARMKDGALVFDTCSSYYHRGGKKRDYRGQIEFFGVFSPDTERVYLVPVDAVGTTGASLRVEPSTNGQTKGIRWAKDFEIEQRIPT